MRDYKTPSRTYILNDPKVGSTWALVVLALVYTGIFGPSVFALIFDSEFMGIDPRSIMDALDGLTSGPIYYNMNDQYHSQFYGWAYFSLNFVLIMIAKTFGFSSEQEINLLVRIMLFLIGGVLVAQFFMLAQRFFTTAWALIASLVFIVNPVSAHYFTTIHPEALGTLFQLLAIGFLLKIYDSETFSRRLFYSAVVALSLSALSKQSYLIGGLLIYATFFISYAALRSPDRAPMTWKLFAVLTVQGVGIFFVILFIIHPYALLEPDRFLLAQTTLTGDHASKDLSQVWVPWLEQILLNFIVAMNFILLLIVPFLKYAPFPYKLSVILTCLTVLVYASNARLVVSIYYIFPVYCILYFNAFYFLLGLVLPWLKSRKNAPLSLAVKGVIFSLIAVVSVSNLAYTLTSTHKRLFLDRLTTTNLTWTKVQDFPTGTKIVYSPNVAILQPLKATSCNAWSGCGDVAGITSYEPDLVVFSPEYQYFEAKEFMSFVSNNTYTLLHEIEAAPLSSPAACLASGHIRATVIEGVTSLAAIYLSNPLQCFAAYKQALDAYRSGQIVRGLGTLIYAKEP